MIKGMACSADKFVAQRLKLSRIYHGLTQQQLAKAVNVSIQQMQKYETGKNRISSGKLFDLAKFLKLPITYFFSEIDCDSWSNDLINFSEKEAVILLNLFNTIKDVKIKKHLIAIIKLIAKC